LVADPNLARPSIVAQFHSHEPNEAVSWPSMRLHFQLNRETERMKAFSIDAYGIERVMLPIKFVAFR
jgi:hypothetical protein